MLLGTMLIAKCTLIVLPLMFDLILVKFLSLIGGVHTTKGVCWSYTMIRLLSLGFGHHKNPSHYLVVV